MNKKQVILYFADLLKEKGIEPSFKYPGMYSKMKRSGVTDILMDFQEETIKKILETIVNEYGTGKIRSDLIKYPLNMDVITRKWVVERAVQLVSISEAEKRKQESQLEEKRVVSSERQEKAIQSIMERIKRGKSE